MQFIATPALLFVALRVLPERLAMLVVVIVLSHLSWVFQSYNNTFLYALELAVYYWALRRRWNLFFADLGYWLLIGIPIASLLLSSDTIRYTILLKQPINGVITVLLANILMLLPLLRQFNRFGAKDVISFNQLVKNSLIFILLIPLFLISNQTNQGIKQQVTERIKQNINYETSLLKSELQSFLLGYQQAITGFANTAFLPESTSTRQIEQKLVEFHKIYPAFLTMLVTDDNGELIATSPNSLISKSSATSVADRDYFQRPKNNGRPFISDAFQGRGFGQDPIVAISAPVFYDDKKFRSVVEGSLDLNLFDMLNTRGDISGVARLVIDSNQLVVFSDPNLKFKFLEKIEFNDIVNRDFDRVLEFANDDIEYIYTNASTVNDWQVISLYPYSDYLITVSESFNRLLTYLLLGVVVALFVATKLTDKINRPINSLISQFKSMSLVDGDSQHQEKTIINEVKVLFEQFNKAQSELVRAHKDEQSALSEKISAEKSSQAKTNLLSKVSHELRTPLNAILGQAQLMKLDETDKNKVKQLVTIEKSGKYLVSLIDDLLQLSKEDISELKVNISSYEINPIILQAVELLKERIKESGLTLSLAIDETDSQYVLADNIRLQQVIVNLISNAIKYNKSNGTISILTAIKNNVVKITVQDTGKGIPTALHDKVFDAFERLGLEHSDIEGSGIGLSLAKKLISNMEGALYFSSVEGEGSAFTVEVPMTVAAKHETARDNKPDTSAQIDLSGLSVCYVEDNKTNFLILSSWLKKQGISDVVEVIDGKSAFSTLRAISVDLIFMDLGLPDIDGLTLFKQLKEQNIIGQTPVIALTADASSETQKACNAAGFSAYLSKPVDFHLVDETMRRVLADK
ncbi:MAG: ATP-binding protein [Kangiellaceae bacterium]|nr:ATP-binding protein [Kangiellaceae bacterium]